MPVPAWTPQTKVRLVFSVIVVILGIVFLVTEEELFDAARVVGWIALIVGVLSVVYNIAMLKKGK